MDAQFEHAITEGLIIAEHCRPDQATPRSPTLAYSRELARLAMRCLPMVLAIFALGSDQEIINIVWGPA